MEPKKIFDFLTQEVKHRMDIYTAPSKIDKYFKDLGFLSSEFTESNQAGEEVGASLFKIVSVKMSGGTNVSEKIVLDYRDKGKIIEKLSKEEDEPPRYEKGNSKNKSLFHYNGPSDFTYWKEKLNLYKQEQNELIQKERERQQNILERETALFTFKIGEIIYASVAAKDNFDLNMLASYGPAESHGILGLMERELSQNIMLINPFWIWCEP